MNKNENERTPRKFNWVDLITTIIGCFLGLLLIDFIDIRTLLSNIFISTIVSVLIIAAIILIVKFIAFTLIRLITKK